MTISTMGLVALAAATIFVGALWAGVPIAGLAPLLILLACPLMMMFMMSGMHGRSHDRVAPREEHTHH